MTTVSKNAICVLSIAAVFSAFVLYNQPIFSQEIDDTCECIAEEYKSDRAYPLYREAALKWRGRKWHEAAIKYHQVIEQHPSSPLAAKSYMNIGLHLKYLKNYHAAIPELQRGISMIPHTRYARDAKTSIACIYAIQGKYDDALNLLRAVLSESEDWDEIKYCSYWIKEILRRQAYQDITLQSCGTRALETVFRLKGINTSAKEIKSLIPEGDITSMLDLKKAAESEGFAVSGVDINPWHLKSTDMPLIALMKQGHYVVISAVDDNRFEVIDPTKGNRPFYLSYTNILQNWTNRVLIFADKPTSNSTYALLTENIMRNTYGGVCDCCPVENLGACSINVEYDSPTCELRVNTVNLNMISIYRDMSYAGLGPAVNIIRVYNADDSRDGPFGRGWTHSYNIFLTEEPSGDVLVNRGSGRIDRYYYTGSPANGISGAWKMNFLCTSTNCPSWSDVGDTHQTIMLVNQNGNNLYAHLNQPSCDMTGSIEGSSFTLSGYWTQEEDECEARSDLLMEGVIDGDTFSLTGIITLTPVTPADQHCEEFIGDGCEEVFSINAFRKVGDNNYITFEPGVYDVLTKNADGSWTLKIKGNKTTQHLNPDGKLTKIVDRNKHALNFGYDGSNKLRTITDAAGRETTLAYGSNNKIVRITDPIGRSTRYEYDNNNNLIRSTDLEHNSTSYTYDQSSYMTEITTPAGTTYIDYVHDYEDGFAVRTITDPAGNSRWYSPYWISGLDDIMINDALGNTTYYDNTIDGMTGTIIDGLSNTTSFGYDPFGNRTSITNGNGHTTNLDYDNRGNITNITDPLEQKTVFSYDERDNLIRLTDALDRVYSYTYDSNDNLTGVTNPMGNQTSFMHDSKGQLTGITDARGNSTSFAYDNYGNVVQWTDALNHTTCYTYDDVGRMTSRTDAKGTTVSYTYDDLDRIAWIDYPDGTVTYWYDCCNRLSAVLDKSWEYTEFEYDNMGRTTEIVYPDGTTITYGYDEVGNLTSITYPPHDKTVRYTYDQANRLTKVTDWWNTNTLYTYDAAGNLTSTKNLPSGMVTSYEYDDADRLISLETKRSDGSIICSYKYTLDAVGNRTAVTGVEPLEPDIPDRDIRYTYNQDNQLLSANGTTFRYDDNGNLIEKKEDKDKITTYTYDYDNRLTQLSDPNNTYIYEYDAFGNRTARAKNSIKTKYILDLNRTLPLVLMETDDSGNVKSYYIYGLGLISKIYNIEDDWENDFAYYYYDGLGNTVALTNRTGSIINKYSYTPFGELAAIEEYEDAPNPFRYVGKFGVMDDENGLLYMRARYYNPSIGRFINKDPIGILGGLNLYSYTGNNPVRFIDPMGLCQDKLPTWWEWLKKILMFLFAPNIPGNNTPDETNTEQIKEYFENQPKPGDMESVREFDKFCQDKLKRIYPEWEEELRKIGIDYKRKDW